MRNGIMKDRGCEMKLTIFEGANPTPSDIRFMHSSNIQIRHSDGQLPVSFSENSSCSSTRSDAESAPPDLEQLFDSLSKLYEEWVAKSGKQLPPQWNMPDLLRFVIGDEAAQNPSLLTDSYGMETWSCMVRGVGSAQSFSTFWI